MFRLAIDVCLKNYFELIHMLYSYHRVDKICIYSFLGHPVHVFKYGFKPHRLLVMQCTGQYDLYTVLFLFFSTQ